MDFKNELSVFKKKIDHEIEVYLDKAIAELKKNDVVMAEALIYVKKYILSGGKRLRAALMYHGYSGAGGTDYERILKTCVSIELIHVFLLIHDDIMDKDRLRHGVSTIHEHYAKIGKKIFPQKDHIHFGQSMAIIIGDMVAALGNQIIFDSGFDKENVFRAISALQSIVSYTVVGQVQDMQIEYRGKGTEDEILQMYTYKTAKYTIEGPLCLGALLAGASTAQIKNINAFAIPIGIAFQIRDDLIGIFASSSKTGKPLGSDIKAGKFTLLVYYMYKNASHEQKRELSRLLGNTSLTYKDIRMFRRIAIETGARMIVEQQMDELICKGQRALKSSFFSKNTHDFLSGAAVYMAKREY